MLWWVAFRTVRRAVPRPRRQLVSPADRSRLSAPMRSDFVTGDVLLLFAAVGAAVAVLWAIGWML